MGRTYSDRVVAGTVMRGSHVRVLRGYIQQDLNAASVPFTWTWSDWLPAQASTIPIQAAYFRDMRNAIQALWTSKGRGTLPNWTQGAPQGPSTGAPTPSLIRASHVTDLRLWLNQYENNHPSLTQGIDSKTYDPLESDFAVIDNVAPNDWSGDIQLLSQQRLCMRLEIRGRKHPTLGSQATVDFVPKDLELYTDSFMQYKNRSMVMFPVFTHNFYKPVGSDTSTDSYRQAFASRVRDFLIYMKNHGNPLADQSDDLTRVIIWNEPNVSNAGQLTPENFARLMYQCWETLNTEANFGSNIPQLYWGGIWSHP